MSPQDLSSAEYFSHDDIFSLKPTTWFKCSAPITNLQVCNNRIVAATRNNTLVRCSTTPPFQFTEIEILRSSDDLVHNVFLDPMGWHTIISMQSGLNFYINRNMKKVRPLNKTKDHLFDSVAWNKHNTNESSTQEILVGTNEGLVFETMLMFNEDSLFSSGNIEQYWKQLANLGHSVTGLEIIRFPPGSVAVSALDPQRCVILATTPSRLYQFAGWINTNSSTAILSHISGTSGSPSVSTGSPSNATNLLLTPFDEISHSASTTQTQLFPIFQNGFYHGLFSSQDKRPAGSKFTEFPGSFGYSDLKLFQSKNSELPDIFAWMAGPGVYFGHIKTEQLSLPPFTKSTEQPPFNGCTSGVTGEELKDSVEPKDVFAGRSVNLTRDTKLIPYPLIRNLESPGLPLGICLTAFHLIIAYADRVKAVNTLDCRTVYSMPLSSVFNANRALGLCRDPVSGDIWIFSSYNLAKLNVDNELCRIWQIYLQRLRFDDARQFCQTADQLDTVNIREAEYCFDNKKYLRSAKLFAQSSLPFEQVALRFSQLSSYKLLPSVNDQSSVAKGLEILDDHDLNNIDHKETTRTYNYHDSMAQSITPLKVLIATKLDFIVQQKSTSDSAANISGQIALLSIWLAQILLAELRILRDQLAKHDASGIRTRLETVQHEFRTLLTQPEVLPILPDAKFLIYELLESHGENDELIFFAELMSDHPRLVSHYIRTEMYPKVLNILATHSTCLDLIYEYATVLATKCPRELVDLCVCLSGRVEPIKLLPALILLPHKEAVRYLETIIDREQCTDQSLHHLLISLYANEKTMINECSLTDSDDRLMSYLKKASAVALNLSKFSDNSQPDFNLHMWADNLSADLSKVSLFDPTYTTENEGGQLDLSGPTGLAFLPYDPGFVLRTCKEHSHLKGTVYILQLLGLHQLALKEALESGEIQLAKQIAQTPYLNSDVRRQLWIQLAQHVIGKQSNLQEAANFLRECPLLRLEDILPYFRDFVTIDQFKDVICASLDSYNERIESVKQEMEATMKSTDELRTQLNNIHNRYEILKLDARCALCNHILVNRGFYVFPCGHNFHIGCLMEMVKPYLTTEQKNKIADVLSSKQNDGGASSIDAEDLIDQIMASDCPLCGHIAINNISELFYPDQNSYETDLAIWQ